MDRKEFLKSCAGGLCACAAAICAAGAAEPARPDDWRLPFVKQRYAKLIEVLQQRMGDDASTEALQELGEFCASQSLGAKIAKYRGDVNGFIAFFSKGSAKIEPKGTGYEQTYDPGPQCSCPFNSSATPGKVCECSVGWARYAWTEVLGKAPKVELKEAVLRGGKVCRFVITPV